MHAGLATRGVLIGHQLSLEGKPLGQRSAQTLGTADVIAVIALAIGGDGDVQYMVYIIVPLRIEKLRLAVAVALEPARFIAFILEYQVHMTTGEGGAHPLRELAQDVDFRIIPDRMDCIETQAITVKLIEPVECVVDEEFTHRAAALPIEGDRCTPRR